MIDPETSPGAPALDCDERGPPRCHAQRVIEERARGGPSSCCTLDPSRRRLDVCLVDAAGERVAHLTASPNADELRHLAERLRGQRVRAVIESMTGRAVRARHARRARLGGDGRRHYRSARRHLVNVRVEPGKAWPSRFFSSTGGVSARRPRKLRFGRKARAQRALQSGSTAVSACRRGAPSRCPSPRLANMRDHDPLGI
jgi:hypothetical protein